MSLPVRREPWCSVTPVSSHNLEDCCPSTHAPSAGYPDRLPFQSRHPFNAPWFSVPVDLRHHQKSRIQTANLIQLCEVNREKVVVLQELGEADVGNFL